MDKRETEIFEKDFFLKPAYVCGSGDELAKETNVPLLDLEEIKSRARVVLSR